MEAAQRPTQAATASPFEAARAATLHLAGELVELLPERALWWARERTLFVADLHVGKPAAFRSLGIPVPESTTGADLSRLGSMIDRLGASRVVLLGDLLHARSGLQAATLDAFAAWRSARAGLVMTLVRGNHDRAAGDPPAAWNLDVINGPSPLVPFVLAHEPCADVRGVVLAGHIHPAIRLHGAASTSLRAPCFWVRGEKGGEGRGSCVLPAFGSFTGAKVIVPRAGDRVFAVGDGGVIEVRLVSE